MMRRLQDCRTKAFAEAGVDLCLPASFRVESSCPQRPRVRHSRVHPAPFPLFPPPEPFRHARTEGQKYIQNP